MFTADPLAWVVLAILAGIIEVSVPQFGAIFVSIAAIVAALAAAIGLNLAAQILIFIIAVAVFLLLMRPRLVARMNGQGIPSRTDALIGREGIVTNDIDMSIGTGRINVGGEDWAARAASPIPAGTRVRVVAADGIVLEVTQV